jgi:hypothetical protein
VWAEGEWAFRNRLAGPAQAQGHAFARFMGYGRQFKEHPEWYPVVNGKVVKEFESSSEQIVEDITSFLKAGTNQVVITAVKKEGYQPGSSSA